MYKMYYIYSKVKGEKANKRGEKLVHQKPFCNYKKLP